MAACVWVLMRPGAMSGIGAVQALLGLEAAVDFGARPTADDAVAANGDRAILDHAPLRGGMVTT